LYEKLFPRTGEVLILEPTLKSDIKNDMDIMESPSLTISPKKLDKKKNSELRNSAIIKPNYKIETVAFK